MDKLHSQYDIVFESNNISYVKMSKNLLNDYLKMYNNNDIQKVLFRKQKEFTQEQILDWISRVLENNEYEFSMIEKDTNEYIGNISIININDDNGELAISITPEKQGNKYGREAIYAIIEYGYSKLGLKNINVNVHKSNLRAINLYKKTGFIEDSNQEESIHMKYIK